MTTTTTDTGAPRVRYHVHGLARTWSHGSRRKAAALAADLARMGVSDLAVRVRLGSPRTGPGPFPTMIVNLVEDGFAVRHAGEASPVLTFALDPKAEPDWKRVLDAAASMLRNAPALDYDPTEAPFPGTLAPDPNAAPRRLRSRRFTDDLTEAVSA